MKAMIARLKQIARKSKTGIIAYRIYDDWSAGRRFESGKIESTSGSTHQQWPLSKSLSYIKDVFEDYLKYANLAPDGLESKRILEAGHGDNVGVALRMLAAGARHVTCLDKFYSEADPEQQSAIYQALREELDARSRARFDEAISMAGGIETNPERLACVYGKGIEEADSLFDANGFDLIVSRAVLEYSPDSDRAFAVMNDLLVPGGLMLHKIDLRDDGMFSSRGLHPLTFLTISDRVYRMMTARSGRCNRKMIDCYRQKLEAMNYAARFYVTGIIGCGEEVTPHKEKIEFNVDYDDYTVALINQIRPDLIGRYRRLTDEELMVCGIFVAARKPV